jgi:transcriptional regulator with XRE-family HTH domain
MADPRRIEFGDFLRSRREKLSPKAVGLPPGRRRRTAGLRREEVAELAGIGVDWYIRLEQGRTVSPSATTIDALARALRLSKAEHAHLRALARAGDRRAFVIERVPDAIRRMVEGLDVPAYVTGQRWDLLLWNAAAADVFGFDRFGAGDRNILLHMLTHKAARKLFGMSWADEAKRMVEQFRVAYDVWAGDAAFTELVDLLRTGSPEFVSWWEAHEVRGTSSGRKRLSHPAKGALQFEYSSFQANDDPALKLVIYTPVSSAGDSGPAAE